MLTMSTLGVSKNLYWLTEIKNQKNPRFSYSVSSNVNLPSYVWVFCYEICLSCFLCLLLLFFVTSNNFTTKFSYSCVILEKCYYFLIFGLLCTKTEFNIQQKDELILQRVGPTYLLVKYSFLPRYICSSVSCEVIGESAPHKGFATSFHK